MQVNPPGIKVEIVGDLHGYCVRLRLVYLGFGSSCGQRVSIRKGSPEPYWSVRSQHGKTAGYSI